MLNKKSIMNTKNIKVVDNNNQILIKYFYNKVD